VYPGAGLAPHAGTLLESLRTAGSTLLRPRTVSRSNGPATLNEGAPQVLTAAEAQDIYHGCMRQWRIRERFPQPDWSIVDLWVARHLLAQGTPDHRVQAILRLASPHFPRLHSNPADYLRRTIQRAAAFLFPRALRPPCAPHAETFLRRPDEEARSNSTGGR
jgi:hypothetical protein